MRRFEKYFPRVTLLVWIGLIIVAHIMGGCAAGTSYQLLGYDAIQLAAVEAQKGVKAYDEAVRLSAQRARVELLAAISKDLVKAALAQGQTAETAQAYATAVVETVAKRLDDLEEQQSRRREWYEVTMDNLRYILDVCEDARQFVIQRADIESQWKAYLQAQARARLAKMGEGNG